MAKAKIAPIAGAETIADQLRAAILASDRSEYSLAVASGVPAKTIGRFRKGVATMNLTSASALAKVLGLRLVEVGLGRGKPKRCEK